VPRKLARLKDLPKPAPISAEERIWGIFTERKHDGVWLLQNQNHLSHDYDTTSEYAKHIIRGKAIRFVSFPHAIAVRAALASSEMKLKGDHWEYQEDKRAHARPLEKNTEPQEAVDSDKSKIQDCPCGGANEDCFWCGGTGMLRSGRQQFQTHTGRDTPNSRGTVSSKKENTPFRSTYAPMVPRWAFESVPPRVTKRTAKPAKGATQLRPKTRTVPKPKPQERQSPAHSVILRTPIGPSTKPLVKPAIAASGEQEPRAYIGIVTRIDRREGLATMCYAKGKELRMKLHEGPAARNELQVGDAVAFDVGDLKPDSQLAPLKVEYDRLHSRPKVDFCRTFENRIRLIRRDDGEVFGFVGDAYVSPFLLHRWTPAEGSQVRALAVCVINKKKNMLGWRAITLESATR
jgi:hypothetical protein